MRAQVYSSPSGKFKPHVDTPRGLAQFGTLVVCLPYRHEGGQLRVAHSGEETIYDWGNQNDIVQWAAFYSDCEHEVYEVTAGHRITLTYNLYAYDQLDGFNQEPSKIDRDSYALYHRVKEALASPQFFPEGMPSKRRWRIPLTTFLQEALWASIACTHTPTQMI